MGDSWENGNRHKVTVGEKLKLQAVKSPYMFPVLADETGPFNPPVSTVIQSCGNGVGCCYMEVEIVEVGDDVIKCKSRPLEDGSFIIFEVLNSDAIVRFY
jgi:hypothetical protein